MTYGETLGWCALLLLDSIALFWCVLKIRSLAFRLDRAVQLREHPDYLDVKSTWQVLREVL